MSKSGKMAAWLEYSEQRAQAEVREAGRNQITQTTTGHGEKLGCHSECNGKPLRISNEKAT